MFKYNIKTHSYDFFINLEANAFKIYVPMCFN